MTWEQVDVATSHKQIWARGVASCEEPEGRQAEAMRLPSDATARQVMMPVSCCCRHLHHTAVRQGCYQHTNSCMTCSAMHHFMALSSHIDGNMMNMALQHASVSAEVVYHCHHSHHQSLSLFPSSIQRHSVDGPEHYCCDTRKYCLLSFLCYNWFYVKTFKGTATVLTVPICHLRVCIWTQCKSPLHWSAEVR